ncbi:MAG: translocation/assembly module TamB domain-containing protein [Cyclobacteriaceae bacterium]
MENRRKTLQVIKKGLFAAFAWTASVLGLLFIVAFISLQIPFVQNWAVNTVTRYISEKTDHKIEIGHIDIAWFDSISLDEFEIKDTFDSTMIRSKRTLVDFSIVDLILNEQIQLDAIRLSESAVFLTKKNDSTAINITHFIQKLKGLNSSNKSSTKDIIITKIKLDDAVFSLNDERKGPPASTWDYYHFGFEKINCDISNLRIAGDTVFAQIDKLKASDTQNLLDIQHFEGALNFSQTALNLFSFELKTNFSEIRDSLSLYFTEPANLSYFVDSVDIKASIKNSIIHPRDIQLFSPTKIPITERLMVSGNFEGKVGRFDATNTHIGFGELSFLTGSISMIGLPNIQETFIDIRLDRSSFHPPDLRKLLPTASHRYINALGSIRARASFLGFYSDFVASGEFDSGIGSLNTNLNLKLPENGQAKYKGQLTTRNLRLDKLLGKPFGSFSMNGTIEGTGLDQESADIFLNAEIKQIELNEYNYTNIKTNAEFASEFFEGAVEIDDPNLKFNLNGTVNLRAGQEKLDFRGNLDTLNLASINLSESDLHVKSTIDINLDNLQLDSVSGYIRLHDFWYQNELSVLTLDSIDINSQKTANGRSLDITTELLTLNAYGDFNYTTLFKDLNSLYNEYKLILANNDSTTNAYYASKDSSLKEEYSIDFQLFIKDAIPLLNLYTDKVDVGKNTTINGHYENGETAIVSLRSRLDTLKFDNYYLFNNELDFNASKIADSTSVLSMLYISSEKLNITNSTNFENVFVEAIWFDDLIDFNANFKQIEQDNSAAISGDFKFLKDNYRVRLKPSQLEAIGKEWHFSGGNEIFINNDNIEFKNLMLSHENQEINIDGILSDSLDQALDIEINNFKLDNLNPLIEQQLFGELNAKTAISGLSQPLIQSDLTITELTLNEFLIGNLSGSSNWLEEQTALELDLKVNRLGNRIISVAGLFKPTDENQLDLKASFQGANLKILRPFISKNISDLSGLASGNFDIGGSLTYPILGGEGAIKDGTIKINYLHTTYSFEGSMAFDQNEIGVRNFRLIDQNGREAIANGGIFHDGFKNFVLDLSAKLNNFQVLNTTSVDNKLYYGTAFLTGDVSFLGPFTNLQISANAKTNRNTKIYIPLADNSTLQQEDFIHFVTADTTSADTEKVTQENNQKVDLRGINMDFDLEITPDAYTELIFDIKSGDIIRGRGNGQIKLQINTDGDFLMFGDMVIQSGGYNFTLKNIINKEFDISEGSKISWFGDPYRGEMDINANYRQLTSLLPLLTDTPSDEVLNSPDARRKYPAVVELNLKGPLLSPEINFDIAIEDYPESIAGYSVSPMINAFNSRVNSDEQEMKRQVFSLIVLRRFSPANSFNVSGGQTIGNSVSEFISNQLSYWVSQVDENLEVDVDLSSLDQDAFNTFQLRLAYTFLNGRLKVSRDGGFTNVNNETDAATIVGDWTVEYLLTNDGKLRAKMYNKTNYNSVNRLLQDQNNVTTGFSLEYTKSFDEFRELLFKAREDSNKKPKDEEKESDPQRIITEGTIKDDEGED